MRRLIGSLLALSLLAQPALAQEPMAAGESKSAAALLPGDLEPWLDGLLPIQLRRADIPGAVVVVVKNGHVLLAKGYGLADVAAGHPVDPASTLFRVGSVSKLFTWTAVMQQVEAGRLDLDRDVNDYLDFKIPPFAGKPISLRNLMTHTAGFEDSLKDLESGGPGAPPALGDFLRRQVPARIFPPGEVTGYSNYGAALAGYIVERAAGEDFTDYVERHIFVPLGMHHSTFRQPLPEDWRALMSGGYLTASEPPAPFEIFALTPAGGATVSGADIARFMISELQDGTIDGQRILGADITQMMQESAWTTISPAINQFLLGFYQANRNGHRVIEHDGDTRLFHSVLALLPDDGVGIFVSLNGPGRNNDCFAINQGLFEGFLDRYFPGPRRASGQLPLAVAQEQAATLAGRYAGSRREDTTFFAFASLISQVSVESQTDGHIVTSLSGLDGQPKRFEEIAPYLWQEIGGKDLLAAKTADGKIVQWAESDDPTTNYTPVPASRDGYYLVPLLGFAVLLLIGNAIALPIRSWLHRRGVTSAPPRSYRWASLAGGAASCVMVGWAVLFGAIVSTFYVIFAPIFISAAMNPWILALHLLSDTLFPLAAATALWNLWTTWREHGHRPVVKAWSSIMALTSLLLFWVGLAFHLIGFGLAF